MTMDARYLALIRGANCAKPGVDISVFDQDTVNKKKAARYCAECPVQQLCKQFAIDEAYVGYWGVPLAERNRMAKMFGLPKARA